MAAATPENPPRAALLRLVLRSRVILTCGFAALLIFFFLLHPTGSSFPTLPDPNGYDVLVSVATNITRGKTSPEKMPTSELAELVAINDAHLRKLESALTLPCAVPVRMSEDWIASHSRDLINLKAAAQAMDAETYFLQQKSDSTHALKICLDQMRIGQAIERGGVLIDFLVGSACETIAIHRMTNLLLNLNADDCKRAARALEDIDSKRDSFDEISAREREWQRKTYSAFIRVREGFKKHILRQSEPFSAFAPDPRNAYKTRTLEFRRLLVNTAASAFELETGRRPRQTLELIPNYLQAIPRDPNTDTALELK